MLQNPWEIYDERGTLQSVQEGCNHVQEYSLTFLKVTDQAVLQARLEDVAEQAALYRSALKEAGLDPDGETFLTRRKKAQAAE